MDGRYEEAERFTEESEAAAALEDVVSQIGWRAVRAKLRARDGESEEALRLANEAVALADPTDFIEERADARVALADVLELGGRADAAREPWPRPWSSTRPRETASRQSARKPTSRALPSVPGRPLPA